MAPRTLADQLRSWPDERIAALLQARPDLAAPAPTDSAQLASRAVVRVSVARALDLLNRLQAETLLAVVQVGPAPTSVIQSVVNASPAAVAGALDRLGELALIWGTEGGLATHDRGRRRRRPPTRSHAEPGRAEPRRDRRPGPNDPGPPGRDGSGGDRD
ncbi:hypothetical protein ABIE44_002405 [Marmoricola sp. OAE513]|uniref:hypothetical protein n=1 Tax=Marmoricola sp. OAE513 TaxID=2817894 RepID=UPI003391C64E